LQHDELQRTTDEKREQSLNLWRECSLSWIK
jgi:hypothetical protein